MNEREFRQLAEQGYTRVPVVAEARADLYTPLAVYMKLAGGPYSYLLESVVGGERFGRYSFIGPACAERIEARGGTVRRLLRDARGADVTLERVENCDPFEYVRGWLRQQHVAPVPAALRFGGGLVGYFGYETVKHVEPRALRDDKPDPLGTPDMLLLVSDELAVVDNAFGRLYLVVYADPREPEAWRAAQARLEALRQRLATPLPESALLAVASDARPPAAPTITRTFTEAGVSGRGAPLQGVRVCRRHDAGADLAAHFARLRRAADRAVPRAAQPQPLALHVLLRFRRPPCRRRLAGDHGAPLGRHRHAAAHRRHAAARRERPRRTRASAQELLADPKERAEHVMLIDLGRNDVGRVASHRQRQGHRADGGRALLARHAHRVERRGPHRAGAGRDRRASGELSRPAR